MKKSQNLGTERSGVGRWHGTLSGMVEEVLLRYCLHNDYAEKEGEKLTITHIKRAQQLKGMHCFKLGM